MKTCIEELKIFARKIRTRRHELEMTQEFLAEQVGCHPNVIGRLERSEAIPSFKTIINLSKALRISPKDLMPY